MTKEQVRAGMTKKQVRGRDSVPAPAPRGEGHADSGDQKSAGRVLRRKESLRFRSNLHWRYRLWPLPPLASAKGQCASAAETRGGQSSRRRFV